MKSYQIITGRDPTCDEDSDLEAQVWLQFPSRNSIHSPKPSLVHGWEASCSPVKRKIQIQNDEGKNHKSLFKRHQSGIQNIVSQILTNIWHHKENMRHIKTVYPPVSGPIKVPCEPRSFLRRSKFSTKRRPSISWQSEAATS